MGQIVLQVDGVLHKIALPAGGAVSVGRAYSNDLTIGDSYMAPEQLRIRASDEDALLFSVENLDATNPIFLNRKRVADANFTLNSGDRLSIGRSGIVLYAPSHPIEQTKHFSWLERLQHSPYFWLISILSVLVLYVVLLRREYSLVFSEPVWGQLIVRAFAPIVFTVIWASIWSLIGRFLRTDSHFFTHLFLMAVSLILLSMLDGLHTFFDYFFSSNVLGLLVGALSIAAVFGVMLGLHLLLVIQSPKSLRFGLCTSSTVVGLALLALYLSQAQYSNTPHHSRVIKAPWVPTPKVVQVPTYIERYDKLFDQLDKR